ncbi:hypothetical protein NSS79_34115 [Paenibacillus sp. FSL L8-0436]|uniref:hypothetical protein n=1 Tax=Paenibacillus sp. FSL L8-0436 TaxID=2954686 RepID=UPI00315899BC
MEEYAIEYGAKRPLKFSEYVVDSLATAELLDEIIYFVGREVNVDTYRKMDVMKACRLIERLAIMVCKAESPTKLYGITKAQVRHAVIQALEIFGGGRPPWERESASFQFSQSSTISA